MSHLKSEEVDHLAKLARLALSGEEKNQFSKQLPEIIDFVDQLRGAKVTEAPDGNTVGQDQLREDIEGSDLLLLEQLEKLAPKWAESPPAGGQVVVPAVFGENAGG